MHQVGDYTKFIILSTPRSGSNYLSQLLHNHPNIHSIGEIFNPKTVWGNPGEPQWERSLIMKYYRNSLPVHFLKHAVFKRYATSIKACGFRLFYDHIDNTRFTDVAKFIEKCRDIKIIHLIRDNTLRSVISFFIAKKTGEWLLWKKNNRMVNKVYIKPQDCIARLNLLTAWQKKYTTYFPQNPILVAKYEDLSKSPQKTLKNVQKFLGVPERKLKTTMVKQNPQRLETIVQNYQELATALKKTPWSHLITS